MAPVSKGLPSATFTGLKIPGVVLLVQDLRVLSTQLIRVAKTIYKQ
jgi:hypothetical protein